jgi:hypothetical protein
VTQLYHFWVTNRFVGPDFCSELLGFWNFSIVWYFREHNTSEIGSISVLRCSWERRHLFSWAPWRELISITGQPLSESESYVTTDGQSASLSWYKAPIWGLRPDFYFRTENGIRLTVTFLIPWGALSDERTGLSFVCAAGPCQCSLSRVLVPWDLRPYFTVSDLRLPFLSPPTTHRVTVEVFDPASTRGQPLSSQSQSHIATDGQSVSKSWCQAPFGAYDPIFSTV